MNLSPDDPRLTAFALGEIADPDEAKQIEAAVAASEELREAVESIRATGAALETAFASEAEAGPALSDAEKAGFYPAASSGDANRSVTCHRMLFWPLLGSVAAVVMIGFMLAPEFAPVRENHRRASVTEEEQQTRAPEPEPALEPETAQELEEPRLGERFVMRSERSAGSALPPETVPAEQEVADGALKDFDEGKKDLFGLGEQPVSPKPERPTILGLQSGEADTRSGRLNFDTASPAPTTPPAPARPPAPTTPPAPARPPAPSPVRERRLAEVGFFFDDSSTSAIAADMALVESESPRAYGRLAPELRAALEPWNTDAYDPIEEPGFRSPLVAPVSTFSIDVDTASYAQVRSLLTGGRLPPPNAVRVEELVNYFPYGDAAPVKSLDDGGDPFSVHLEQAVTPWAPRHRLLRVSLKGYKVPWEERPASNLVFLIDVSGSMNQPNKLPLVKEALQLFVDRLDKRDRVGIVVYAGASSVALPSTTANNTETIRHAIEQLNPGGSTNANDGIQSAYATVRKHFIEGGNNRVILCTDGDFNVGITDRGLLGEFAGEQADEGVSLTVLGFGMGNYKDNMLETLSAKGKGVYGYIDTPAEARKFFLQQLASNLFTIAHDVKIQVEFNPNEVRSYRLIGYENRRLKPEDFNDDTKRAGDIGPGHSVTAFYEVVPAGVEMDLPGVDELRYQATSAAETVAGDGELATVKLRYKRPAEDESQLIIEHVAGGEPGAFEAASEDLRFGAAVAAFGLRLRGSKTVNGFEWGAIREIALNALGQDPGGHRAEFLGLVEHAEKLSEQE